MEIISIIAEYNPFHQGHAYQIQKGRALFGGSKSAVMVVMSGCFTQRGEPAITDKWSRTRMALKGGADLVIELPFPYACSSAERFASGAVQLLHMTGLRSTLLFGSESGDLNDLDTVAGWLKPERADYQQQLRKHLDQGYSFPRARQCALEQITEQDPRVKLLEKPNNILAVEYLKAIRSINACRLTPRTIQRVGQHYHERQLPDNHMPASAQAIRQTVQNQLNTKQKTLHYALVQDLLDAMPAEALAELLARIQSGPGPLFMSDFAPQILPLLRSRQPSEFSLIAGMSEGLPQRLCHAAEKCDASDDQALETLIQTANTRRFTQTRIQRALIAALAGLTQEDLSAFDDSKGPCYIRVLGFNRQGRYLLKMMRKKAERPIMTRASDFLEFSGQPVLKRMAQLDLTATDLWQIAAGQSCGCDFDRSVIIL